MSNTPFLDQPHTDGPCMIVQQLKTRFVIAWIPDSLANPTMIDHLTPHYPFGAHHGAPSPFLQPAQRAPGTLSSESSSPTPSARPTDATRVIEK